MDKISIAAAKVVILITEPAVSRERFNSLIKLVSEQKQEKIKRFHSFKDAQNSLLGDVLARTELCRMTGLRNEELVFTVNEHGKPLLQGNHGIHFNISHSGCYVVLAIDNEPVGIDIETIKPVGGKIAERFFAPDEIAYINEAQNAKSNTDGKNKLKTSGNLFFRRFFEVWTKKESRIKWEGKGLSKPLASFSVFDTGDENGRLYYHEVKIRNGAICHTCGTKAEPPHVIVIGVEQLGA